MGSTGWGGLRNSWVLKMKGSFKLGGQGRGNTGARAGVEMSTPCGQMWEVGLGGGPSITGRAGGGCSL